MQLVKNNRKLQKFLTVKAKLLHQHRSVNCDLFTQVLIVKKTTGHTSLQKQ